MTSATRDIHSCVSDIYSKKQPTMTFSVVRDWNLIFFVFYLSLMKGPGVVMLKKTWVITFNDEREGEEL